MTTWADRFRKPKTSRRHRHRFGIRSSKSGCATCGGDHFAHKPNSYYGHIEHAYKKR